MGDTISLRYNHWEKPADKEEINIYEPDWESDSKEVIENAGHGGGDYFVIKEFFDCIREKRKPEMDEYFATTCASVAILSHRSLLEKGVPYDIPDFRKEEDRIKYENDTLTPFMGKNGEKADIPCCSVPDFRPTDEQYQNYLNMFNE